MEKQFHELHEELFTFSLLGSDGNHQLAPDREDQVFEAPNKEDRYRDRRIRRKRC